MTTFYEVRIPLSDGRWTSTGPAFRFMTSAELWALRNLPESDYLVTPAALPDDSEEDVDN